MEVFMLVLLALAAQAQSLSITGECPGTVDVELTDVTPAGRVLLLRTRFGPGFDLLTRDPCDGLELGLAGAEPLTVLVDADGDGVIRARPRVSGPTCDWHVQAVDLSSCGATEVRGIGDDVGGFEDDRIVLAGGEHFIQCFGGLVVDDAMIRCEFPLFDQEVYSLDRSENQMLGLHNSGEDWAEGHAWLLEQIGAELGYAGSRVVEMNVAGPDNMWDCTGDGGAGDENEWCYVDGTLRLWRDEPACHGGLGGGCNVVSAFELHR
ncbi:MAG: hypothetical protein ACI9K2_001915 [Myxococcota bacterium]